MLDLDVMRKLCETAVNGFVVNPGTAITVAGSVSGEEDDLACVIFTGSKTEEFVEKLVVMVEELTGVKAERWGVEETNDLASRLMEGKGDA